MSMTEKITAFLQPTLDSIDETFADVGPLTRLCTTLKVRPAFVILPFFVVAVISLGTGVLSHMFVAVVGMLYPAYQTYRVPLPLGRHWRLTTSSGARSG